MKNTSAAATSVQPTSTDAASSMTSISFPPKKIGVHLPHLSVRDVHAIVLYAVTAGCFQLPLPA